MSQLKPALLQKETMPHRRPLKALDPVLKIHQDSIQIALGSSKSSFGRLVNQGLQHPWVRRFFKLPELEALYQTMLRDSEPLVRPTDTLEAIDRFPKPKSIHRKLLDAMHISVRSDPGIFSKVPRTGPLMIVSNHPLSGIEGLAIAEALSRVRPDLKILANTMAGEIEFLKDHLILFNATDPSEEDFLKTEKEIHQWLSEGHALVVFPAGAISDRLPIWNRGRKGSRESSDPQWNEQIFKAALNTRASILPVYVPGEPGFWIDSSRKLSRALYSMTSFKPIEKLANSLSYLSLALTLREIDRLSHKPLIVNFGSVILPDRAQELFDADCRGS